MSYDKTELEKKALEAIKRNRIKFITHVAAFLPCALSTFYELELEKSEVLKNAVENNRTNAKVKALNRWERSKNPTLEVAFYKLIGDDDEVVRLNGSNQKIDHSGVIGSYQMTVDEFKKQSAERLKQAAETLDKFDGQ